MATITENKEIIIRSFTDMKQNISDLQSSIAVIPESTALVTRNAAEEIDNAKVVKEYAKSVEYKRGDFVKGTTTDFTQDLFVIVTADFTSTEESLEGQIDANTLGEKVMTLDPTIGGSSYGVNKEYVTQEWNTLITPIDTRIKKLETALTGVETKIDEIMNKL